MIFTVLELLNGQSHMQLPVLPVRHNEQVFMPVIVGMAIHVMDDFSGLERASEVVFCFLPGPF